MGNATIPIKSVAFAGSMACAFAIGCGAAQPQSQSPSEWSIAGGSAGHWGYSATNQINDSNVSSLGLLWSVDLPVPDGLVGNPQIIGGIVYQSAPEGIVVANDVATGKLVWRFQPTIDLSKATYTAMYGFNKNRGMALDEQNAYVATACDVFAINRMTGQQVWKTQSCDPQRDNGIVGTPHIAVGELFVGQNIHELSTERGYEDAFDAATGKHLWRFYTVPGDPSKPPENKAMEMAAKTWDPNAWKYTHGGAPPWDGAIYDPKTDLLIFGSGDAHGGGQPDANRGWMRPSGSEQGADTRLTEPLAQDDGRTAAVSKGDWLFAASVIAVHAKTGEYAWHFQPVPHNGTDQAADFVIADLSINGRTRHVIMQAAKNGFFYVLDAQTGKCISANNYVPVTTYTPPDPKTCQSIVKPEASTRGFVRQPGGYGAHNWQAIAYSPNTHLVYIPAYQTVGGGNPGSASAAQSGAAKAQNTGWLVAWDPVTQKERWRITYPGLVETGGVLTTAGNLVLHGTPGGKFLAYSADTGKLLWSYDTKSVILGQPATVMLNGKQIILVPAGDGGAAVVGTADPEYATTPRTLASPRLLAFALGGTATLPDTPPKLVNKPPLPPQPAELAAKGARIFNLNGCALCHGPGAVNGGSHIPDLRNAPQALLDLMPSILQQGALRQAGMPQFMYLSDADVEALRAYIVNQAWTGFNEQSADTAAG